MTLYIYTSLYVTLLCENRQWNLPKSKQQEVWNSMMGFSCSAWRCCCGHVPCVSQLVKHRFRSGVENTKQPGGLGPAMSLLIETSAVYGKRHRADRLHVCLKPQNMILSKESPHTVISKDKPDKTSAEQQQPMLPGGSLMGKAVIQKLKWIHPCSVNCRKAAFPCVSPTTFSHWFICSQSLLLIS